MKIGVAISTHNRRETALLCVENVLKYTPNAYVAVVDDGSDISFPSMSGIHVIRNDKPTRIAHVKNQCLKALMEAECDYLFLFDDDCWPIIEGYYRDYIESGIHHLSYSWGRLASGEVVKGQKTQKHIINGNTTVEYASTMGCMLFFTKECIERIGGFNERFYNAREHGGLTYRIGNAGLTPWPNLDIENSGSLFYSADRTKSITTTVPMELRTQTHKDNELLFSIERCSSEYIPYDGRKLQHDKVVLGVYLTTCVDPQRNRKWKCNPAEVKEWADSCIKHGYTPVLFTDELDKLSGVKVIKAGLPDANPYRSKWILINNWLTVNKNINELWITDVTDCRMSNAPEVKWNVLYSGVESGTIGECAWLARFGTRCSGWNNFARDKGGLPLLNCGVVGGDPSKVIDLVSRMVNHLWKPDEFDMHPYIINISSMQPQYGPKMTSVFKEYEQNSTAWWTHK
jgi:hypothetical protein